MRWPAIARASMTCAAVLLLVACGGGAAGTVPPVPDEPVPPVPGVTLSVNAGTDKAVATGALVTLTATADPADVDYEWMVISKPDGASVVIASETAARMKFTPPVDGAYRFRVTVSDELSNSAHDEITVVSSTPSPGVETLETYDAVTGHTSDRWTATVSQGTPENSPVLYNDNSAFDANSSENHWTQFSFTGAPVEVVVTDRVKDMTTCVVRPLHDAISTAVNTTDDSCTFTITQPGQWFVDTGEYEEPLFIFASAIDESVPVVNGSTIVNFDESMIDHPPEAGTTVIFEPGYYDLDNTYTTGSTEDPWNIPFGVHLYIKGGAWVDGLIRVEGGSGAFSIRGRGTLAGSQYQHISGDISGRNLLFTGSGSSVSTEIEGITFADPVAPIFRSFDTGLVVRDTKWFGQYQETGAIRLNADSLLEDSFFKTNDDNVNIFGSNITVNNNVHWAQSNGCQYQLSWQQTGDHSNDVVSDIDVIHNDRTAGFYFQLINAGVVCGRHVGTPTNAGYIRDQIFQDFRIEVAMFQLFSFTVEWEIADFTDGYGSYAGITFRNWVVAADSLNGNDNGWFNSGVVSENPSHDLTGENPGSITGFIFDNVEINGSPLEKADLHCEGLADCDTFTVAP